MALVTMADAVAGQVALAAEYNKHKTNILDLDARLGAVTSGLTAHARLTALEAITSDTATAPGGIGNQRLADRLGTGVGTTTNVTTGHATAQLTDIRTRLGVLESGDVCYVYQSVATNVTTNTVIPMDAELIDTNTMHSTSTNTSRITIKKAGIYMVGGGLGLTGGGSGRRIAWVSKNGVVIPGMINIIPPSAAGNNMFVATTTAPVQLAVNDYLELFGYVDGGPLATQVSAGYNSFLAAAYLRS